MSKDRSNGDGDCSTCRRESNDATYCDYGYDDSFFRSSYQTTPGMTEQQTINAMQGDNSTFPHTRGSAAFPANTVGQEEQTVVPFPAVLEDNDDDAEPVPPEYMESIYTEQDTALKEPSESEQNQPPFVEQARPRRSLILTSQRDDIGTPDSENHPTLYEVEAQLVQDPENPPVYDAVPVIIDGSGAQSTFWQRYQPAVVVGVILLVMFLGGTLVVSFAPWEKDDTTTTSTLAATATPTRTSVSTLSATTSTDTIPVVPSKRDVPFLNFTTSSTPFIDTSSSTATSLASTPSPSPVKTDAVEVSAATEPTTSDSTTTTSTTTKQTSITTSTTPIATSLTTSTTITSTKTSTTQTHMTTLMATDAHTATTSTITTTPATTSTTASVATTTTSAVPCKEFKVTLIERTKHVVDCKDGCANVVAIDGDSAIVTRDNIDIQFLSYANGSFEEVTTIPFSPSADSAAISGGVAALGYTHKRYDGKKTGGAYAYEKDSSGNWIQTTHIGPSALNIGRASKFGIVVDIDESWLVIGVPESGHSQYRGSVHIYSHDGHTWRKEAKLAPGDIDKNVEWFGASVSIKGSSLVVGDFLYGNDDEGAVFIYEYDPSSQIWDSISLILNPDCPAWFGADVKLTEDGSLLAGCPAADVEPGAVYYYTKSATGEYVLKQKITASTDEPGDFMGAGVAVDGHVMLANTLLEKTNGKVHIFRNTERGIWIEVLTIDGPATSANFGINFDVSYDSEKNKGLILVGSDGNTHHYALECS